MLPMIHIPRPGLRSLPDGRSSQISNRSSLFLADDINKLRTIRGLGERILESRSEESNDSLNAIKVPRWGRGGKEGILGEEFGEDGVVL